LARWEAVLKPGCYEDALQCSDAVVTVPNDERSGYACDRVELTQESDPERMEGGRKRHSPLTWRKKRGYAITHFGSCLVGKGDRQDRAGRNSALDHVCSAVGDGLRLPRTCSGDDKKRSLDVQDCFFLSFVQSCEVLHRKTIACELRKLTETLSTRVIHILLTLHPHEDTVNPVATPLIFPAPISQNIET
jgi:hypothetical protein